MADVEDVSEGLKNILSVANTMDRDNALVALAHSMVVAIVMRRATLPEMYEDVDQLAAQMKQLCKWNIGGIHRWLDARDEGKGSLGIPYTMGDPEQFAKSYDEMVNATVQH